MIGILWLIFVIVIWVMMGDKIKEWVKSMNMFWRTAIIIIVSLLLFLASSVLVVL